MEAAGSRLSPMTDPSFSVLEA